MKKKLILSSALVLSLSLSGCGNDTTNESKKEEKQTVSAEITENKEVKQDENEVKDGVLNKPGQWTREDDGSKVTLVKINESKQTHDLGPIKLTIESVKLFQYTDLSGSEIEHYKANYDKDVTKGLSAIQIKYTVENTTDANIMFHAIDTVTTDTKAQISGTDNTAMFDDTGTYKGKVIVQGVSILPYFSGPLEDINAVNVITSDAWDLDSKMPSSLNPSQKIEIAL